MSTKSTSLLLLATENDDTRQQLRQLLSPEAYVVIGAESSEQCLSMCMKRQPDVVILDAMLSDRDGFATCTQLKTMKHHSPVLMLVPDDPELIDRAFAAGADNCLVRPFQPAILVRCIRQLIQLEQIATSQTLESQFQLFVEYAPAAIAMFDLDMKYIAASRRWLNDYRIRDQDIIGKSHYEVFPEIPDRWKAIHQRCLAGAVEKHEADPFPRADGSLDWVRWEIYPWCDSDGKTCGIIMFTEVINERKQAQEALRSAHDELEQLFQQHSLEHNMLQTLLDTLPDAVYVKDRHGQFITCNPRQAYLAGVDSPEELLGKTDLDIFPERGTEYYADEMQLLQTGKPLLDKEEIIGEKIDARRWHLTSKVPMHDAKGNIIGLIGIGRDITERKQAEEALRRAHDELEQRVQERTAELVHANAVLEKEILERKQAEKRVMSLGRILEESLNEIYVFDAETLRFVEVDRAARENLGYSMGELRELTPLDIKPEYTPELFAELVQPLRDGEAQKITFDTIHQRKDGSRYPADVHLQLATYRGSPAFVAVILDITEKKQAEAQLRKLSRAVEQSANCIVITDTQGDIEYVNPKFTRLTGYSAAEAIGQNPRILKSGHTSPEEYEQLWATITSGGEWRGEFLNKKKDGELYWENASISPIRDANGTITHFLAVKENITKRKQAEAALAQERNLLRTVLDNLPAHIYVKDIESRLLLANADCMRYWGWTALDDYVGKTDYDFQLPKTADLLYAEEQEILQSGQPIIQTERTDHSDHWLSVTKVPFRDNEGNTVGLVGFNLDITKRKQAEMALHERQAELSAIYDNVPLLMLLVDEERRVEKANHTAASLVQRAAEEMLGLYGGEALRCVHSTDHPLGCGFGQVCKSCTIRNTVLDTFKTGNNHYQVEARIQLAIRPGTMTVLVSTILLNLAKGQRVLVCIQDITERKQAEEALRESRGRFRQLFNSGNDAVFVYPLLPDNMPGQFIEANDVACQRLGYTREELLRLSLFDISEALPESVLSRGMKKLVEDKHLLVETTHIAKDGRRFPVEINAHRFKLGGQFTILAIARDITERKRAEELLLARLRLSEFATTHSLSELLQKTLDEVELLTGSQIGFFHILEADQETLSLQMWSTNTLAICTAEVLEPHYSVNQAGAWVDCVHQRRPVIHNDYANLPHRKGLPQGHVPVIRELVVPVFRENLIVAVLGIGNKPDDYSESDVEIVSQMANMAWDIVMRKQAEIELRKSKERFEKAIRQAPLPMVITDTNQDIVLFNDKFTESFGYTLEDVPTAQRWWLTAYPDEAYRQQVQSSWKKAIAKAVETSTEIEMQEWDLTCKDRSIRRVEFKMTPLGETSLIAMNDITERKRAEQAQKDYSERLQALTHQLMLAQEKERQRISRELHDEVGQALTAMKISLEIVAQTMPGKSASLQQQLFDLAELVDTTMEQVRIVAQDLRPAALDTLGLLPTLEGHCNDFARRAHLNIEYHADDDIPQMSETANIAFYRVLQEALTNIARYANAKHIIVRLQYEQGDVTLIVEDDGQGFDVNQRILATNTGAIGLIGMQERFDLLGGRCEVQTTPGKGTCVIASIFLEG